MTGQADQITATERTSGGLFKGRAVDCDVHVSVPSVKALLPYLDSYWRQQFVTRGIDRISWNMTSDPPNAPHTQSTICFHAVVRSEGRRVYGGARRPGNT